MARMPKGQSFSAYTEPSFQFWFEDKWYTEQGAKTMIEAGTKDDIATLRSEYTRMRDTAQKRIKRLGKLYPESKAYQAHPEGFPKLRDIEPQNLAKAFSELAKFVRAKTSTVTGQRRAQEKTTNTLNEAIGAGQDDGSGKGTKQSPVTKDNYWRVIKILNGVRQMKIASVYGSDKIVTLADVTLGLSSDQFDQVMDHLEKFLDNIDSLGADLEIYRNSYMDEQDKKDLHRVDIDDFMEKMGY